MKKVEVIVFWLGIVLAFGYLVNTLHPSHGLRGAIVGHTLVVPADEMNAVSLHLQRYEEAYAGKAPQWSCDIYVQEKFGKIALYHAYGGTLVPGWYAEDGYTVRYLGQFVKQVDGTRLLFTGK